MKRAYIVAVILSVVTELLLFFSAWFSEGGNAQGIWIPNKAQKIYIYTHIPAKNIADSLNYDFAGYFLCGIATGIFQFFLIYCVAVVIWRWIRDRVAKRYGR
jgi:hypothetical protein